MSRRRQRGQAMVELALGSMLLVTMLVAGIYFGEVTFGALKVEEAAHSAMYDVTHYKHHDMGAMGFKSTLGPAVSQAENQTFRAYQDFDGRSSVNKGSSLTHVFTATNGMNVKCWQGGAPTFTPNIFVNTVYADNPGVSCSASAEFETIRIPQTFAEGSDGFFNVKHWARKGLTVCSAGKGGCNGRFSMMVDDWGLTGPNNGEWNTCMGLAYGIPCTNLAYWWSTYTGYLTSYYLNAGLQPMGMTMMYLPASLMATSVAGIHPMGGVSLGPIGGIPWNESTFYMSFPGSAAAHTQLLSLAGESWPLWETDPNALSLMPYHSAEVTRMANGGCYLGTKCY